MKFFRDKHVFLTGAGSGMGREIAILLSDYGAKLALTDWNLSSLEETKAMLKSGAVCYLYHYDVGNYDQAKEYTQKALSDLGHIDILINNAGFALGTIALQEVKMEDFRKIVEVNLWGVIYHTQLLLGHLLSRPIANISNTSSIFGLMGVAKQIPYCTTKFAVRGFTEALRMEMMEHKNLTVSCIHPGGIQTNIYNNAIHYADDNTVQSIRQRFDKATRVSAKDAALVILKGIAAKKKRIMIGYEADLMDGIARLAPVQYTPIARTIMQQFFGEV